MKTINDKQWKRFLFSVAFLLFILGVTATASLSLRTVRETDPVSPALALLAKEHSMAMAGIQGSPIEFEHDDFARAMNLSEISQITVTEVPPITDGELRVGSIVVEKGQTIRKDNLALLSYVASSADIATSSFRFRVGTSPVEMTCHLYLLSSINQAPTLSHVPKASLNVSTHKNVTLYGTLPCYDPDGDETQIEIVSYPSSGILVLTDRRTGEYTYTPNAGASGKDSFTYVARDKYGNYSASATVSLSVLTPSTSVVYADLESLPCHHAALAMTEAGIMRGTQVGNATYFYPAETVSRADFVVMAMRTLGINEVAPVEKTVFADDAALTETQRNYIGAAYELEYLRGELSSDGKLCFYPDRTITRAEAAVILSNMIDAATPTVTPVFEDSAEIPVWASPAIYSLNAMGILSASQGNISPQTALTRGDAAVIFHALMRTTTA